MKYANRVFNDGTFQPFNTTAPNLMKEKEDKERQFDERE